MESTVLALIATLLAPPAPGLSEAPAERYDLAQSVTFSPKCVTSSMICFGTPKPLGSQCQCPDYSWGTIKP